MKTLIDTCNITLDYIPNRGNDLEPFRLSIFDKYCHYLEEINLSPRQLKDLIDGLNNINIEDIDEDFDD